MGKKLALNVFYTIGLFISVIIAYWGYQHTRYAFLAGGILVAIMFIVFKVKLLKDLKATKK